MLNVIHNAEPVADFALGMMLDLTRDIALSHRKMREGVWMKSFYNSDHLMTLSSHMVALAGIGNVGSALARRLLALGVPVIAYDAYTSPEKKAGKCRPRCNQAGRFAKPCLNRAILYRCTCG